MLRIKTPDVFYHPAFLSFILWIVLAVIFPPPFTKYRIKILSEESIMSGIYYYFCDLDNDGTSEKISIDLNDKEQTKIIVRKNERVLDQYNLPFQPTNRESIIFRDCNNDGNMEMFVFTIGTDAIYLTVIDPVIARDTLVFNRLIDTRSRAVHSINKPYFVPVETYDTSGICDGGVTFCITSGFCLQPRNLYRYFWQNDSLIKSPRSYATINECMELIDPENRVGRCYLLSTQATGNTHDTAVFSDVYTWLMVLNDSLQFSFNPVIIGEYPSRSQVIPLYEKESLNYLVLHDYIGTAEVYPSLSIYDNRGNKLKEKIMPWVEPEFSELFSNYDDGSQTFYFLSDGKSKVELMDNSLNVIQTLVIPGVAFSRPLSYLDADGDGKREYFFLGADRKSVIICRDNFKNTLLHSFTHDATDISISQVIRRGAKPMLHFQNGMYTQLITYERNWAYYLRIPSYIFLYCLLYLFIVLVYHFQKKRLELKTATEKQMATLQMKAIRNQLDPHFTLNVLNAIGSLYATEGNRDKADYIFGKYARLLRQTVISSDEIIISLEEEIDFVRNYIEIEKFRRNNSFEYIIDMSPGLNLQARIPRMLIHSFVENSIKYGIRKMSEGGILKIALEEDNANIIITVEDNGPGMTGKGTSPEGTGKGMTLIKEMSDLYYRLNKVRIITSLENVVQSRNLIAGTRATILLPYTRN